MTRVCFGRLSFQLKMSPPTALSSVSLSNNALFEGSNLASSDEFCSELLENCKKSPHTHRRIAFNDYELYWDDLCSFENVYTTGSVENCIIHPLSGAFAAVFNTSIISIFDCHANMKLKIDPKKEGINSQVLHAEWRTSCDELVCVFADGTVGIFDYFNKSIQWLSLKRENVQTNSELEEKFVVIAAEFRNDKLYCLVRSSTLIVATLDANSNFHDIEDHQLESGCIDFSFVSDDLILFKSVQNANYAYSLSLQSGQEILNGRKIIFPVYHSRNGEYLGFFFQSRKKGLRLEICDKSMEKWYASIKLNEIPKNVMILNADLQIIFYETYFTVIIEDKFKKVDCYQSFVSLQISAFSFVLLTAVGFECLKFLRKDLFDLDEVKKLTHVQIAFALQTFLDLALQDWTENLDNFHSIWIQKAKELAAASSELVCDKTSLARSLKFIQIVARIRLDHTIACFFVSKDNFDVLVSLLIQRKAFHCCTLLADAYDCVKSLENVFIEWMIDRSTHHKHTNSFGSVSFTDLVKENSLSLCNHVQLDLKKIVEFALKRQNIQFLCILLANEHSNFHEDMYILEQIFAQKTPLIPDDFAQILLLLIQKNSVGNGMLKMFFRF